MVVVQPTELHYHPNCTLKEYVMNSNNTIGKFYPNFLLINAHVQTVGCKFLRLAPNIIYKRDYLTLKDGGAVALDWDSLSLNFGETVPTVILFHGLVGSSTSKYMRNLLLTIREHGWRSVVFNARGVGTSELKSPRIFNASNTEDARAAIRYVKETFPKSPLVAVGFSLGANILIKYLGEEQQNTPIVGAVSISNPFDLGYCHAQVGTSNLLYNKILTRDLHKYLRRHQHILQNTIDWDHILQSKSIVEFDNRCVIKMFEYNCVEDYYRESSSAAFLPRVSIPTLCLNSLDDPVIPKGIIPHTTTQENPNLIFAITKRGGHVGYLKNFAFWNRSWSDGVAVEFLQTVLTQQKNNTFVSERSEYSFNSSSPLLVR